MRVPRTKAVAVVAPRSDRATTMLARYDAQERLLIARGFPATSPWWRAQIQKFYTSRRRRWVVRVGRRGGKSSTLCRIAVLEALWGGHRIPPGDIGLAAFVSVSRDESSQRLRTIRAILDAQRTSYDERGDEIVLRDRPIGFKTFAASVAGVSGPTCFLVVGDEVAKWRDEQSGSNPATEVIATATPTTATQKEARTIWSSSPTGSVDAHARMYDEGDNDHQVISYAPTWIANPTVTEADTHALESDARRWAREYKAVPQAGLLGAFDADAVMRAFTRHAKAEKAGEAVLILDPSSGGKDAWTWGIARWVLPEGATSELLRFEVVDGISGRFWDQQTGDAIVERLSVVARQWKVREVHSDQRESLMLASAFSKRGLRFTKHDWSAASKPPAVERVRRWLAEGTLSLPVHEAMQREMLGFEERVTASGAFTFGARGSGHDDYVSLLLTAAMADIAKKIRAATYEPIDWSQPIRVESFESRRLGGEHLGGDLEGGGYEVGGYRTNDSAFCAELIDRMPHVFKK